MGERPPGFVNTVGVSPESAFAPMTAVLAGRSKYMLGRGLGRGSLNSRFQTMASKRPMPGGRMCPSLANSSISIPFVSCLSSASMYWRSGPTACLMRSSHRTPRYLSFTPRICEYCPLGERRDCHPVAWPDGERYLAIFTAGTALTGAIPPPN